MQDGKRVARVERGRQGGKRVDRVESESTGWKASRQGLGLRVTVYSQLIGQLLVLFSVCIPNGMFESCLPTYIFSF